MQNTRPAIIRPTASPRRGPRPRRWWEACVRHALRNYSNPRALRRNPLIDVPAIAALTAGEFSETWNPHVAALRHVIDACVENVLATANQADRHSLETVLRGAMSGRTMRAIAADLSYGREWLHKTWWPEAVQAVTTILLARHLRVSNQPGDECADDAAGLPQAS